MGQQASPVVAPQLRKPQQWHSANLPPPQQRTCHAAVLAAGAGAATAVHRKKGGRGKTAAIGGAVALAALAASAAPAAIQAMGDVNLASVIAMAMQKAVRSGSAGFIAGTMQVLAFMWLRTTMNYQYKFGGTMSETLKKLYKEGGIGRFYRGLFPWAIFQAPLSRFGDVAMNTLVMAVASVMFPTVPVPVVTVIASMSGALWRVLITPIDTCKTVLQTDGPEGAKLLLDKVKRGGIFVLWAGWEGNYAANVVGNYPFFVTMNLLSKRVPVPAGVFMQLVRFAFLGACSSSVSDLTSNSIRVVKTTKQTHPDPNMGYFGAAREVLAKDGITGLMFRGLETRIFTNILQGAFFTVLWKYISGGV